MIKTISWCWKTAHGSKLVFETIRMNNNCGWDSYTMKTINNFHPSCEDFMANIKAGESVVFEQSFLIFDYHMKENTVL